MSKRFVSFLVVLMMAGLLLAACGGGADEAAVEEPAAEEAAAEEPAAEEAAAEPAMEEDPWGNMVFEPGTEIKMAVSSALSGGYAVYGQDMLNGTTLAVEDFGGDLMGWSLIVEGGDDGCEGAAGVTVAEQFAADPQVLAVIGPMCSGSAYPASDIYAEKHVIMLLPSVTAVVITNRGYENIFRTVANDDLQAKVTVDFLTEDLGIKTLAVLHDQSLYGEGIGQAVSDKFEAAGGTVTGFEGVTRGESDYSAVVNNILTGEPESIYWGGMDAEGALLINQLRAAGFEGVFIGPDGIKSVPSYIEASGGAAEGSYATFGAVAGAVGVEEWNAHFAEQFGDPVAYGPGSYDSAMIILNAAKAVAYVDDAGNLNIPRFAMAEQIRATAYDGVTGHLEFTETGDLGKVSITVFQVVDGDFVDVKTVAFGE